MTDRFTPGPWRSAVRNNNDLQTSYPCVVIGGVIDGVVIDVPTANPRADADLIAAAPDLLEACRRLLGWAFWDQGGSAGRDAACARAAIRRATGEKEQEARDVT